MLEGRPYPAYSEQVLASSVARDLLRLSEACQVQAAGIGCGEDGGSLVLGREKLLTYVQHASDRRSRGVRRRGTSATERAGRPGHRGIPRSHQRLDFSSLFFQCGLHRHSHTGLLLGRRPLGASRRESHDGRAL